MTSVDIQGQSYSKINQKVKNSEVSGMGTDQVEQFYTLLNQSTKALNKNQEAQKPHALISSKRD